MRRILVFFIILFLLAGVIYYYLQYKELVLTFEKSKKEAKASALYIKKLEKQINKKTTEIPKQDKLRKLLDDYFDEKQQKPQKNISTKALKSDLERINRENRFLPKAIPVKGEFVISQKYHENHKAVDFAADFGSEVVATAAGVMIEVYEDKYFGNVVVIDHLNGYKTMYAHLARVLYSEKTFLEKGEVFALVGDSGNSTDSHLHYEVHKNGVQIDPGKITDLEE